MRYALYQGRAGMNHDSTMKLTLSRSAATHHPSWEATSAFDGSCLKLGQQQQQGHLLLFRYQMPRFLLRLHQLYSTELPPSAIPVLKLYFLWLFLGCRAIVKLILRCLRGSHADGP